MKQFGANYRVEYLRLVAERDVPGLDKPTRQRIKKAIENKLMIKPEVFGLPLRGTLKNYWKLRVGDWRVVYLIEPKVVKIIIIAHRREVYNLIKNR